MGLEEIFRVVPAMPEEMRPGPVPHGAPWELVIGAVIGIFTVLLFLWRSVQCVRSRLYLKREKKLALKLIGLIEEKCKLLDKVSLLEKEYRGLEASLKDANSEKESKEAQILETINEMLNRCKSNVGDKILFLEKELKEENSKRSQQEELMAETSQRIKSLEDQSKSLQSQVAEAKTTLRILQRNEETLKAATKEALNENPKLREIQKHLLEEAEMWKGKVSDLNKEKMTFEDSKVRVERILIDEENPINSLTEQVVKMREWAPVLREDIMIEEYQENELKLHRKLTGAEKYRLEEERRLSEVEKRIRHAAEQLETCKKQAKGLEEELDSTYQFYHRKIMSYEKKSRDNGLAAWATDGNLKNFRQENDPSGQKLAELEFQFQLLEQDPPALGVSNPAFGREHAPHQATGGGFVCSPLAPIRGPLLPVEAGSQFMGRGPFLPPPPPRNMYGTSRDDFTPGPPLPPFPMQNVHSPRLFPHYLPPRAGFFPATPTF